MTSAPHLSRAPIREAVIDIRLDCAIEVDKLKSLESMLPSSYDDYQPTVRKDVGFTFNENKVETKHEESLIGYRSDDKDRSYVVQFQNNGMSISKLTPYENWDSFKQEAEMLWGIYKSILDDFDFTRVAVRYINEIRLPVVDGMLDFDDYLINCPKVPEGMPDKIANFLSRVVVPYKEEETLAMITTDIGRYDADTNCVPLVLDIDVSRSQKLSLSEQEIWGFFEVLREIKNNAFHGSITTRTRELYE